MAYDILGFCKSIKSTNDLFTVRQQYYFVKIDSNGQIVVCAAGNYSVGVVQDTPKAGDPGLVCGPGALTKVMCGGSFSPGQYVMSNSTGQAVAASSSSHILGIALTAGVLNYIAEIIFQPIGTI